MMVDSVTISIIGVTLVVIVLTSWLLLSKTKSNVFSQWDDHERIYVALFQSSVRSRYSWCDGLAHALRDLITDEGILLIVCALLWCSEPMRAYMVNVHMVISEIINGFIKFMVCRPRPFWGSTQKKQNNNQKLKQKQDTSTPPSIVNIDGCWESDFSFPSSHAQVTTSIMVAIFIEYDNLPIPVIGAMLVIWLFCCLARVHLGVHMFTDIIMGAVFGTIVPVVLSQLHVPQWFIAKNTSERMFVIASVPVICYSTLMFIRWACRGPTEEQAVAWEKQGHTTLLRYNDPHYNLWCKRLGLRQLGKYHYQIWCIVGGSLAFHLAYTDSSLTFLHEHDAYKHLIYMNGWSITLGPIFYRVLIGIIGLLVIVPFIFIVPDYFTINRISSRDANTPHSNYHMNPKLTEIPPRPHEQMMAHVIKCVGVTIMSLWLHYGCPKVADLCGYHVPV